MPLPTKEENGCLNTFNRALKNVVYLPEFEIRPFKKDAYTLSAHSLI